MTEPLEVRNVGSAVVVVKHPRRIPSPSPVTTATFGPVTDGRIRITATAAIDAAELVWRVSRSGGPGGQHANTSDTRVEVVLDVRHCSSLTPRQRSLITSRLGPVVRAVSADSRSQARNREIARERLVGRLAVALRVETPRRATKPSRGAREDRLRSKRQRSDTKRGRSRPRPDPDGPMTTDRRRLMGAR